mmetsp:Transcript_15673/g.33928  ORF Transcript_15673/g.33928 Transcript_15673/m.33928 type:complete len:81 (-) Transcript_15673:82-324(-)
MLTTSRRKAKSFPVVQARVTQSAALVKQQQAGATFGVSTMNDDTADGALPWHVFGSVSISPQTCLQIPNSSALQTESTRH